MAASRLNRKDKQRKVNKFYNFSIAVVSLLIVIVAVTIFFGNNKAPKSETAASNSGSEKQQTEQSGQEEAQGEEGVQEASNTEDDQSVSAQDAEEEENVGQEAADSEEAEEEEGPAEPKVGEPVGTTQTGEHVASFEKGSADWNEMTQAMAAGTGLDPANMTIWWLGNGGAPNKAVGTVSAKNDPKKYKVYMEWVDGEGWKPVSVE
ncbi:YrrS family protein [Bacillus sp. V5-8f]|uniref:YrrS family protein n=1 Tax=Bacillus sp. V5-8f TaxID=2053044 RepID=UPI000C781F56|nr:YrrS family protein [Bacillus sp. V5-8f]PLT34616.1 DNA primase [Bacillus sp. V5-8f]